MNSQVILWVSIGLMLFFGLLFWRSRRAVPSPSRLNLRADSEPKLEDLKILNVIFMYNGHSFDAHEVLGLPAGCGNEAIDHAYKKALRENSRQSREFIEAAYKALTSAKK